jgi:ATP-dependent DNA helicase PIF1
VFFPILKHIRTLSFVIIDECSMLDYYLLKYIDLLCKTVKRTSDRVPFGGIQMMICGDFFQLPCITDRARPVGERFCFQTDVWNEIGPTFQLQTVVRQNEEKLVRILHKIRAGAPDEEVATFFESRTVPDFSPDDEQYAQHTVILPLRREVDAINSSKLAQVAVGKEVLQWAAAAKNAGEQEFGNTPANIVLCVGLRVMVTANVDPTNGIYNGAKGTIVDMVPASATVPMVRQPWFHNDIEEFLKQNQKRVPVVLFDNGERRAIGPHVWYSETKKKKELLFCQLPIILAYAITVHKCQSATIDNIVVDLRNCFEDGMVYVAVSRCTRTDGIVIIGFDMSKISANEQCVRWAEAERRRLAVGTNDEEPASRL